MVSFYCDGCGDVIKVRHDRWNVSYDFRRNLKYQIISFDAGDPILFLVLIAIKYSKEKNSKLIPLASVRQKNIKVNYTKDPRREINPRTKKMHQLKNKMEIVIKHNQTIKIIFLNPK